LRANSRGGNAGLNVGVVECGHEGLKGDAATLLLGQYLQQQHAFNTQNPVRKSACVMRGAPIARHAAPERGRVIQQHSRSSIDARGHTAVLLSTTQKQCCCCEASQSSACCEQRALTHDTTNSSPLAFEHMQRRLSCGSAACHLQLLGPHMKKVFDGGPRAPMRARVAEGNSSLCCRSLQERASFNEQQAARLLGVTKQRNSTRNSSTVAGRHQAAQFNTQQQHGRAAPRTIFARQCSGDPRCRCPPPRSWGRRRCTRAAKKKELGAEKWAEKRCTHATAREQHKID